MGILIAWLAKRGEASNELRLFLATGLLGGFTTFSAFSLDFAELWQRGEIIAAMGYAASSVIVSLLAIFTGFWLIRNFA